LDVTVVYAAIRDLTMALISGEAVDFD